MMIQNQTASRQNRKCAQSKCLLSFATMPKPLTAKPGKQQFVLVACWLCEKEDCDLYCEAARQRRTFWLCERHASDICPVCGKANNFYETRSSTAEGVACVRCLAEKSSQKKSAARKKKPKRG